MDYLSRGVIRGSHVEAEGDDGNDAPKGLFHTLTVTSHYEHSILSARQKAPSVLNKGVAISTGFTLLLSYKL